MSQEVTRIKTHELVADQGIVAMHDSARRGEAFKQMCDFLFQLEALEKVRVKAEKGRSKERDNIIASIEAQQIEIRGAMKRLADRHYPMGVVF